MLLLLLLLFRCCCSAALLPLAHHASAAASLCVHSSSGRSRMGVGGVRVAVQRCSSVVVVGGMVVSANHDTKI
jgi:hypothetical protein